jgi:enoyl-CoA hydratase/carnithine racemase
MRQGPFFHVRHEPLGGGSVAFVTLENEARLNALSSLVMDEFVETFAGLAAHEAVRAVVLAGAGSRAFVGGADVDEMAAIASPAAARAFIGKVHACCRAARELPVPVIAAISGWCLGAGLELAAACDLRVADEAARLGMPEVKLGIPSVVEAALLPRIIGWAKTRELLLFGEVVEARAALSMGLIDELASAGELDAAIETRLTSLLTSAPGAVRLQKALIRQWEDLTLSQAVAAGIDSFAAAFETPEPALRLAEFQAARRRRKGD